MRDDQYVCLCFHVTKRKLLNFIRVEKPRRASQLSQCFGAGTGCGWCRTYLRKLLECCEKGDSEVPDEPTYEQFASQRSNYVRSGQGTPPAGAIPIDTAVEPDSGS